MTTLVSCRAAPGLAGLRHRIVIRTERGLLEIDGRFHHGAPWRFEPLRLAGAPLQSEARPADSNDPWIAANVAAIGDVLAVLRGELDEASARARGLCDLARAFALDDTIARTTLPRLTLRGATAGDLDLTYAITREAMQRYVEQTWGPWDEAEQQAKHRENFDPATTRIVQLDAKPVGLITVEHHADHDWLVKLYLLERARSFGLGAHLLRLTMARADAASQPLRLRVLRVNTKARALYTRHGFRVTEETAERFFMERAPLVPRAQT